MFGCHTHTVAYNFDCILAPLHLNHTSGGAHPSHWWQCSPRLLTPRRRQPLPWRSSPRIAHTLLEKAALSIRRSPPLSPTMRKKGPPAMRKKELSMSRAYALTNRTWAAASGAALRTQPRTSCHCRRSEGGSTMWAGEGRVARLDGAAAGRRGGVGGGAAEHRERDRRRRDAGNRR